MVPVPPLISETMNTASHKRSSPYHQTVRRIRWIVVVLVGSLAAQNAPPPVPPKLQAAVTLPNASPVPVCAIPLLEGKVENAAGFSPQIIKPGPIDPQLVLKAPMPTCSLPDTPAMLPDTTPLSPVATR